ncbi:hypothetical protein [Kitasatospora azatica]|uniref:hypothetical protein n=1 Tax=Kitasatospora azatica TaxID=58347 RepID=UPI00056702E5|nr:hypothetical protein [Kitasatospora azatica]
MPFDDKFTRLLQEAAELAPDPPGSALADAAERRSRRHTARRRAAVAGGAAALLVVGLGAAELRPGGLSVAASHDRSGGVSAQFMIDTLTSLLPPGRISEAHGSGIGDGSTPGGGPQASLLYDDGHGAALVQLTTDRLSLPVTRWTGGTQCPDPFNAPVEGCTRTVRPDGSVVVFQREAPRTAGAPATWTVLYTGTDGRRVRIDERNSRTTGAPTTRPQPPLGGDQLTAVAVSAEWDLLFAEFTVSASAPPAATAERTPSEIIAAVEKLLPAGARCEADPSKQVTLGTAHLTVTLEGRTSMLTITALRDWNLGLPRSPRETFDAAPQSNTVTHTADGTSVVSWSAEPGTDGGTVRGRVVHTQHPDGTRVEVVEWSGTNGYQFTDTALALSSDQLAAIAADTSWI